MARNAYVEDFNEWQLVLCGDENTIPAASEDNEHTLRAQSEVREGIHARNHELPICLNTSDVIATTYDRSDEVVRGDADHRLYSKANTIKSITGPSGHVYIDVETETGRIKWSGPMSGFPAFMETRRAAKNGTSELCDKRTVVAQEKAKTTGLGIEKGLAEIRKSLLQATKDKDEAQVILLLENGADANSEDDWGPPITQAQSGGLAKTVKKPLIHGALAPRKIQQSSRFSQTTIEGVFPPGTKLDISMPDGTRQIIASGQRIIARNVSAGSRSFQFIGDATSLGAFLRE